MSDVKRIYVEKKPPYAGKAKELLEDIRGFLNIFSAENVRYLIRYDVEHISDEVFEQACVGVFAEPPVDFLYRESLALPPRTHMFSVEALPGQYDQRADSAEQCIAFIREDERPVVRTAETYLITGDISDAELEQIKAYVMNPVDSRIASDEKPDTLAIPYEEPADVAVLEGFCEMPEEEFQTLYASLGLAMTRADFDWIRAYFTETERRDPTITEVRVLDTYWSDHCRHTTFSTELTRVDFADGAYAAPMRAAYADYLAARDTVYATAARQKEKFVCLMDIALMGMRKLKADGRLTDMEISEENNACSVVVPVEIEEDGAKRVENWLVFFKNETHNHPTEIEPFGGAATCLGGAIRDPLSGRGYVYQAMRVTGAADPTVPMSETLPGKLPQKKLVRGAAKGYSSYGNQIGLATGYVREIYHPDYVAKRMEIGAVMGAAKQSNVRRERPEAGDVVILLGGRTGRDGIGGATGSSKAHNADSLSSCGAEVQKGNAPTERKIQRLFRRPEVSLLIRKCNDFGAGGVSVAIGELADGLDVDLDRVPKKYAGLDGTELAISESQERMAVVVSPADEDIFLSYAAEENLEAVRVAVVTDEPRLVLRWRGKKIVDLSRAFLNTNGAHQETTVRVTPPAEDANYLKKTACAEAEAALAREDVRGAWLSVLKDLNVCSQKGLVEMFDASIGAGSVTMPYGGVYQETQTQAMAAKLPVQEGKTDVMTLMAYGFDPYLSAWSPFHGAVYAVTESMARIVASGGDIRRLHFTFQEYFARMRKDPSAWGAPFAALLGAFAAQEAYGLAAIGGKDSMSGSFNDRHVPPTLVSFAVGVGKTDDIITPELKRPGNVLVEFRIDQDEYGLPEYDQVLRLYDQVTRLMRQGVVKSCYALDSYGIAAAVSRMAFGSGLGVRLEDCLRPEELFANGLGNLIAEVPENVLMLALQIPGTRRLGMVSGEDRFAYRRVRILLDEAKAAWNGTLEKVFPTSASAERQKVNTAEYRGGQVYVCKRRVARPTVFIPVFPGTNCEYDSAAAFERAGANVIVRIFRNRDAQDIRESMLEFDKAIRRAQIVMFPGGFSAGDEPDGSAKFFATAFRNERLKQSIETLLDARDGLVLGICNGFQAIVKLGLVPYGRIRPQTEDAPTLTYNQIGRHISKGAYLKVVSNRSPWLMKAEVGGVYISPVSHGEGRFVAPDDVLERLFANGQVATQYCDPDGNVTMDDCWNVNGSYLAVEGITSPDGRCYGKMAHAERRGEGVAVNLYGEQDMRLFESGVAYFQ